MDDMVKSIKNLSLDEIKKFYKNQLNDSIENNNFEKFCNYVTLITENNLDINDGYLHKICKDFDEETTVKKEMIKILLMNGSDINKKDYLGCSPFSVVCYNYFHTENNFEFFKWFVNIENISFNSIDCDNLYPIDYLTIDEKNRDVINYLENVINDKYHKKMKIYKDNC